MAFARDEGLGSKPGARNRIVKKALCLSKVRVRQLSTFDCQIYQKVSRVCRSRADKFEFTCIDHETKLTWFRQSRSIWPFILGPTDCDVGADVVDVGADVVLRKFMMGIFKGGGGQLIPTR